MRRRGKHRDPKDSLKTAISCVARSAAEKLRPKPEDAAGELDNPVAKQICPRQISAIVESGFRRLLLDRSYT